MCDAACKSTGSHSGVAADEIEVTPEMISAGSTAYVANLGDRPDVVPTDELVVHIYGAMRRHESNCEGVSVDHMSKVIDKALSINRDRVIEECAKIASEKGSDATGRNPRFLVLDIVKAILALRSPDRSASA